MPITPASIRNKNPGAMYPGRSSKKFGSTSYQVLRSKDGTHKIATFDSHVQGAAAQFDLLASSSYTGRTVKQAIQKWCGGFYVTSYIRVLEDQAGLSRNSMLTRSVLLDQGKAIALAKAMAWQEAGRDYPMSDAEWAEAHALAFPGQVYVPVATPPAKKADKAVADIPAEDEEPTSFEPENPMPSPKPETRVEQALKNSGTLWGIFGGALAWLVQAFEKITATLLDAATQFSALAPAKAVLSAIGVNVGSVAAALGISCLAYAASRRLRAAAEGKIG